MDSDQKTKFIRDLTTSVVMDIIASVRKMPEEWDGHELRQFIADKFAWNTTAMTRSRMKDYKNEVVVRNL
ncbi:MAG: hypothetical protein EBW87_03530 [Burkholderiaceae bacterium]|nr:hypothetical protein [Burkholderiaceae bacterium]